VFFCWIWPFSRIISSTHSWCDSSVAVIGLPTQACFPHFFLLKLLFTTSNCAYINTFIAIQCLHTVMNVKRRIFSAVKNFVKICCLNCMSLQPSISTGTQDYVWWREGIICLLGTCFIQFSSLIKSMTEEAKLFSPFSYYFLILYLPLLTFVNVVITTFTFSEFFSSTDPNGRCEVTFYSGLYSIYAWYLLSILDISQVTRRIELMCKLCQLALWYQLFPSSFRRYTHRNIQLYRNHPVVWLHPLYTKIEEVDHKYIL
jgi:hypothetical protein